MSDLVVFEDKEDPANIRVQNTVIPSYAMSKQQIKWLSAVSRQKVFIEAKYVISWLAAAVYPYDKNAKISML